MEPLIKASLDDDMDLILRAIGDYDCPATPKRAASEQEPEEEPQAPKLPKQLAYTVPSGEQAPSDAAAAGPVRSFTFKINQGIAERPAPPAAPTATPAFAPNDEKAAAPTEQPKGFSYKVTPEKTKAPSSVATAEQPKGFSYSVAPAEQPKGFSYSVAPAEQPKGFSYSVAPAEQPKGFSYSVAPAEQPKGFRYSVQPAAEAPDPAVDLALEHACLAQVVQHVAKGVSARNLPQHLAPDLKAYVARRGGAQALLLRHPHVFAVDEDRCSLVLPGVGTSRARHASRDTDATGACNSRRASRDCASRRASRETEPDTHQYLRVPMSAQRRSSRERDVGSPPLSLASTTPPRSPDDWDLESVSSFGDVDGPEFAGPDAAAGPPLAQGPVDAGEQRLVAECVEALRPGPQLLSLLGGFLSDQTREWMRVKGQSLKALLSQHAEFEVLGAGRGQHACRLVAEPLSALPSISWAARAGPSNSDAEPWALDTKPWAEEPGLAGFAPWEDSAPWEPQAFEPKAWDDQSAPWEPPAFEPPAFEPKAWAPQAWEAPRPQLRLRGLPFHATKEDVWALLAQAGAEEWVEDLTILYRRNGRPTGQAIVTVQSPGVERVWRLHLAAVGDRYLEVLEA